MTEAGVKPPSEKDDDKPDHAELMRVTTLQLEATNTLLQQAPGVA